MVFQYTGDSELGYLEFDEGRITVDVDTIPGIDEYRHPTLPGFERPPLLVPCWDLRNRDVEVSSLSEGVHGWQAPGEWLAKLDDYEYTNDPAERGKGKIYVDEDDNGYCPHTGGKLVGYCF